MRPFVPDHRTLVIQRNDGSVTVPTSYIVKYLPIEPLSLIFMSFVDAGAYFLRSVFLILYLSCDFGLSDVDASMIYAWYGIACLVLSVLLMVATNEMDPVRLLWVGALCEVSGTFILIVTHNLHAVKFALWLLIPLGSAIGFPVTNKLIKALVFFAAVDKVNVSFGVVQNLGAMVAQVSVDVVRKYMRGVEHTYGLYRFMFILSASLELFQIMFIIFGPLRGDAVVSAEGHIVRLANPKDVHNTGMTSAVASPETGLGLVSRVRPSKFRVNTRHRRQVERLRAYQKESAGPSEQEIENRRQQAAQHTNGKKKPLRRMLRMVRESFRNPLFIKFLVVCFLFAGGTKMIDRFLETLYPKNMQRAFDPYHAENEHLNGCVASVDEAHNGGKTRLPETDEHHKAAKANVVPWGSLLALNSLLIITLSYHVNAYVVERFKYINRFLIGAFLCTFSMLPLAMHTSYFSVVFFIVGMSFSEMFWGSSIFSVAQKLAPLEYVGLWSALAIIPMMLSKFMSGVVSGILLETYCPDAHHCDSDDMWAMAMMLSLVTPVGLVIGRYAGYFNFDEELAKRGGDTALEEFERVREAFVVAAEEDTEETMGRDPHRRSAIEKDEMLLQEDGRRAFVFEDGPNAVMTSSVLIGGQTQDELLIDHSGYATDAYDKAVGRRVAVRKETREKPGMPLDHDKYGWGDEVEISSEEDERK